jgi:hypothetical protein
LIAALLGVGATRVDAQEATAEFLGTVVNKSTGAPLVGVRVVYLGSGATSETDASGRFLFTGLPAGLNRFMIWIPGQHRSTLTLAFADGERVERVLEFDATPVVASDSAAGDSTAQRLATVAVTTTPPMDIRYRDFERRMKTGRGQYVTRQMIEENKYNELMDVMRNLRGVRVDCGGGGGCFATMARAPMGCSPEYIVDDMVMNSFGRYTPIRDIEGIEVYTGASDVPGEYAGRNAGCGLIIIWTKNGPARKAKPKN